MGTHPIFESDFDCLTEWYFPARLFFLVSHSLVLSVALLTVDMVTVPLPGIVPITTTCIFKSPSLSTWSPRCLTTHGSNSSPSCYLFNKVNNLYHCSCMGGSNIYECSMSFVKVHLPKIFLSS